MSKNPIPTGWRWDNLSIKKCINYTIHNHNVSWSQGQEYRTNTVNDPVTSYYVDSDCTRGCEDLIILVTVETLCCIIATNKKLYMNDTLT